MHSGAMAAPGIELATLPFPNAKAFGAWLAKHHATSPGVWLKLAKAGSGAASVTYPEAIEQALAWGWIDGQKRGLDEHWWLQKFTRRAPKSLWSAINCKKVEALIAAGAMQPPGLAEVERAKADGRWAAAYAGSRNATVPDDLAAALAADKKANAFFAALDKANRYAILFRIQNTKTEKGRSTAIARYVAMCARGEKIHP
jgi:uncharacterized protein YdeI (YjbR/CyaY-like superfamily)